MYLMNLIYRAIDHICRRINRTFFYESKVGIKSFNQAMCETTSTPIVSEPILLGAEALFIGSDGLKDELTLCGINLFDSPHYDLMRAISEGKDLNKTNYIFRYTHGTLDGKKPIRVRTKEIERFFSMYQLREKEINDDTYKPVKVFRHGEKYYIFDGKHRAALCALKEKKIKCIEISEYAFLNDPFNVELCNCMMKKYDCYNVNLSFFGFGK